MPAEKSFDEILAPFRRNVEENGMGDEEPDDLFTTAREEASRERKDRPPHQLGACPIPHVILLSLLAHENAC
jgi:hypothetical protein